MTRSLIAIVAFVCAFGATTADAVPSARTSWTTSSSVSGSVAAISCPTVVWCMAVGAGTSVGNPPQAWTWTPSGYSAMSMPASAGFTSSTTLAGVSCATSKQCVAVGWRTLLGGATVPAVARWTGGRWTVRQLAVSVPGANDLTSITCPTVSSCIAVGDQMQQSPSFGSRSLISTATFSGSGGIGTWVTTTHPFFGLSDSLTAIACSQPGTCVAVGSARTSGSLSYQPLIETLSAGTWTPLAPPVGSVGYFTGVSCTLDGACTVAGSTAGQPSAGSQPLLASELAGKWTFSVLKISGGALEDISCVAVTGCRAVGTTTLPSGATRPLSVAVVNGNANAFAPIANPTSDASYSSVSCPATGECRFARNIGSGTGARSDLVRTAPPFIRLLSPSVGPSSGGTKVTITGLDLAGVTSVTIGGVRAKITKVLSPTQLQVTTARHLAGAVSVILSGSGGTSPETPLAIFTYR